MRRLFPLILLAAFAFIGGAQADSTLSDPQFFSLLDLTRPGLASVKKCVAQSDWTGATHALAGYMRNRPMPHWDIDPTKVGLQPGAETAEADEALRHKFDNLGIKWQFGNTIDWKFNPTTQPGSKWPRNHEWTWSLNRHVFWVALAKAYYDTGDEKYAREIGAELTSWVRDCPVPDKMDNAPYSRWRTIEAGIRMGTTWPEIYPRILHAKAFSDADFVLMLKSCVDHAHYLMKFHTERNWLTMEENGLYTVGALFPEFKDAKLWRDTAVHRLDQQLDVQVYPDGAQFELTPGYHCVALGNFLGPVKLTGETGFEVPGDYRPKLEGMFSYLLYSMAPDGTTPPLNDSGEVNVGHAIRQGVELFPQRKDFLWAETNGKKGAPPQGTSCEFPYAGQFFMRSGWDRKALWLCMDGGPFGAAHQHEDKTSVIISAFGKPLLVEGGTYTYDASEWRAYVLSSRAHNVVLVDGMEQNRRRSPPSTWVVKDPLPHVWESNAAFDHAASRYDEGWGPQASHILRQTRHVFYIKPDVFVIADELESLDGKPHLCEALFHLDAPDASVSGLRVETRNDGPNLAIEAFGADGVKIVKGQKEPVVQGWLPQRSAEYGAIKPIPTAIYSKMAKDKATVLYVLYPSMGNGEIPVRSAQLSGNLLTVQLRNGGDKQIRFKEFPR
jgi:hypothetical protein